MYRRYAELLHVISIDFPQLSYIVVPQFDS